MKRRWLIQAGPTVVLAVAGTVEVLLSTVIDGPVIVLVALVLSLTVPLVWRRRRPVGVLVATLAVAVLASQTHDMIDQAAFALPVFMLTAYSAALYGERRQAQIAAAVLAAFTVTTVVLEQSGFDDLFFIAILFSAPFIAGRVVRSRQQLAAALAARTVELEHEREEKARMAVAEERARIARELHDVVAHNLSVMIVQAGAERRVVARERPETAAVLETIESTGRSAMAEMRRLLGMLRRSDDDLALAPQPSIDHLDLLVSQIRAAGMPVELRFEGEPYALPPGVDLSAYRIVQEALTNALKHAGPARARVTVRYGRDELDIEVADDGSGTQNGDGGGHGLVGMRERVALFGGDLAAGRRTGGGFEIRARLPLARSGV
jgi:signal transduction histidine kinase